MKTDKIAVPVKTNREAPAIAPLFGKAKWFAIIEDDKIEIIQNPCHGGTEVAQWLINQGVTTVLFQEMGDGPYGVFQNAAEVVLYHTGFERTTLSEALEAYNNKTLKAADEAVMEKVIAHHESKHDHGHHGHHHHGHHDHHC